jgi:hypothetical protein
VARFTVATTATPTATGHIRLTGTSNRELMVDYLSTGTITVSNTIRRMTVSRVTTDGTGTAVTPEKTRSRSAAFHGTAGVAFTASPTTTGSALLILDTYSPTNRHARWSPPRPGASIYLLDTERICLFQAGTGSGNADTVGFSDSLADQPELKRLCRRTRHRYGHFARAQYGEWIGGSSTSTKRFIDKGHLWQTHPYWTARSAGEQSRRALDNGGGPAPVEGGGRLGVSVAARAAASKTGTSDGRLGMVVVGRATPGKLGLAGGRLGSAVAQRSTATKVAVGGGQSTLAVSFRALATKLGQGGARAGTAGLLQGVGTVVVAIPQGFGRLALGVALRGQGSKVATGGAQATLSVSSQSLGAKVGQAGSRVASAVFGRGVGAPPSGVPQGFGRLGLGVALRGQGSKVATGTAGLPTSMTARAAAVRTALGGGRQAVAVSMRSTGTKSVQGGARLAGGNLAVSVARKVMTGAGRLLGALVGRAEPGSQVPPLPVAHRATASLRHRAFAQLRLDDQRLAHEVPSSALRHDVGVSTRHAARSPRI